MRIYIEADSIASERMSGIGHATLEIIRQLDAQVSGTEHKLSVIVPYGRKAFVKKYHFKNVHIRQLPPGYKYVNYALTRTSLPFAVDLFFGRGVYIFPNYKNWYVPLSTSYTFVHDIAFRLFPETIHPKNLAYLDANFNRWLSRTARIITISKQSQREIIHEFPAVKDRVSVVYLGVDEDQYKPRVWQDIQPVRAKYGIAQDYFITVGNIEPRKNIDTLISAYKIYADTVDTPAQLVIVGGDGWKNKKILDRIEKLQQEGYAIYRPDAYVTDDDLAILYAGARANIHVALHEGFGLPPVQAQACGTPVIASNLPVFQETLNPKLVTYVTPVDAAEMAAALQESQTPQGERSSFLKKGLTWRSTVRTLSQLIGIIKTDT